MVFGIGTIKTMSKNVDMGLGKVNVNSVQSSTGLRAPVKNVLADFAR